MGPVLIVDLAKRFGGADVRVIELARAFHGIHPYAVATLKGSPLHAKLVAEQFNVLPVPFRRSDPRIALFLFRAIRRHGFTLLDTHNPQSQFWGLLAAYLSRRTRHIATVHSNYRNEHNNSLKGRAYEGVLRLNARSGTQCIAVSESVHAYLRNIQIPPGQLSLIPNGLRVPDTSALGRHHPLLQSLGWGEDIFLIISVARLEPVKGHTYLLEALRQIILHKPQVRCLIVGDGRSRATLEAQAQQSGMLDYVHFAGFRSDIPDLLSASDVFCMASLTEGLPFALLEASALRVPLLVTEVGGMAELLTHKQTAYLVPPEQPQALAEGIGWLYNHPAERKNLGQRGFDLCQQRFSPEKMISQTLEVYQQGAK